MSSCYDDMWGFLEERETMAEYDYPKAGYVARLAGEIIEERSMETGVEDVSATYVCPPGGGWWQPPLPDDVPYRWPDGDSYTTTTINIGGQCEYCEGTHPKLKCPRLKSIEYDSLGQVKKVEFKD